MRVWILPLFALLLSLPPAAHAVLSIEISQKLAALKPLAILPFADEDGSENIANVVRNDLNRGGLLQVVAENDVPLGIALTGAINDESWQALPGDLLLRGSQKRVADGKYTFSYELLRRDSMQTILAERFSVGSQRWRDAGHYISDRVFEALTGDKDRKSTRLNSSH